MFVEASVPGRVNLFGNPLDIYGGLVISSSITRRANVRVESASGLHFALAGQECVVSSPADLASRGDTFDFLRALFRSLDLLPDCRVQAATDIPVRSGLAGSAALMLAASAAVLTFAAKPCSSADILQTAHRAEVEFLNNFCGWNDFYSCILGAAHEMRYRSPGDGSPNIASLSMPEDDVSFAIVLTGDMHRSGAVNRQLWDRWRAGDAVVRAAYDGLAAAGAPAHKALEARDWRTFGRLMSENFACQYRLGAANEIEKSLVEHAIGLGAFGAKLCGAGHCGSIVILARKSDHARIRDGLGPVGAQHYFPVVPTEGLTLKRG